MLTPLANKSKKFMNRWVAVGDSDQCRFLTALVFSTLFLLSRRLDVNMGFTLEAIKLKKNQTIRDSRLQLLTLDLIIAVPGDTTIFCAWIPCLRVHERHGYRASSVGICFSSHRPSSDHCRYKLLLLWKSDLQAWVWTSMCSFAAYLLMVSPSWDCPCIMLSPSPKGRDQAMVWKCRMLLCPMNMRQVIKTIAAHWLPIIPKEIFSYVQ